MNQTPSMPLDRTTCRMVLALAIPLLLVAGLAGAQTRYLDDGAIQNARGGWDLPAQGTCPAGDLNGYTGIDTRPECVALRLNIDLASCISPNYSWTTGGVCNDTLATDQAACEAKPDRLWNPGTSTCAIKMEDDDRNDVVCMMHNGFWSSAGTCTASWVMPNGDTYDPDILTAAPTAAAGAGDQCLRCHNNVTQYNGPRLRDTEETMMMGHKNMARKVTVGTPWGGPPFSCSVAPLVNTTPALCAAALGTWDPSIYPGDDSGHTFDWDNGTVNFGAGDDRDLLWIYGDWLAALPRAIYAANPATGNVCVLTSLTDQTSCEAAHANAYWVAGVCERPDKTTSATCTDVAVGGTWMSGPVGVCSDPRGSSTTCRGTYAGIWVQNTGVSYSCGRCHTTGWTSDAAPETANTDPRLTKEPERSFPGVTWDRDADAAFGQVNLSGGVTGDPNQTSSWDVWGIGCARCHSSAIDESIKRCYGIASEAACNLGTWDSRGSTCMSTQANCTTMGGSSWDLPFGPPAGMSTHHNGMTAATVGGTGSNGGYCSDVRFTAQTQCDQAGAAWLTACTVPGVCSLPAFTTSGTCLAGGGTWTKYNTQALCTGAVPPGVWLPSTVGCSIAGVCNDPAMTTAATCTGTVASGALIGLVRQWKANSDIIRCEDAGGHFTGSMGNRGQIITRLCMDCHRQETGGLPYDSTNPATALKVGPAHGTVSFVSHPAGNEFLNSPHGKFSGKFDQIATGQFGYAPSALYKSHFINDGEAANTGNGCTGCHEVHNSVVAGETPFREECTECHTKDVNQIMHPTGLGTPIESKSHPFEACISCHMPEGRHLFRINVENSYSTFPMPEAATTTTTVNANTAPDGNFASAVWVDLDLACGQCHGGGNAQVVTTGTIAATSKNLTVANSALFTVGQRIEVAGAGGFYYDEEGAGYDNVDLETFIASIPNGTTLALVGAATVGATNAPVVQNQVKNNAAYFTKTQLAGYAKGIHNDKPIAYFSYKLGSPNTLQINVDASASSCSGSLANCNAFAWSWGDGTPDGSGLTATHTYVAGGTYPVKLTVTQYSIGSGERTANVTVYTPDNPPVVAGTCTLNADTWVATVTDTSSDDNGLAQMVVNWGDNSVVSNDTTVPFGPFSHTYIQPGTFTVARKVVDSIGQQTVNTSCVLTPTYFTISGNVKNAALANVQLAAITVKKGLMTVRTVYTDASGNYTVGNLKPGTYSLTAKKTGLIFPVLPTNVTVGPPAAGINFVSSN